MLVHVNFGDPGIIRLINRGVLGNGVLKEQLISE